MQTTTLILIGTFIGLGIAALIAVIGLIAYIRRRNASDPLVETRTILTQRIRLEEGQVRQRAEAQRGVAATAATGAETQEQQSVRAHITTEERRRELLEKQLENVRLQAQIREEQRRSGIDPDAEPPEPPEKKPFLRRHWFATLLISNLLFWGSFVAYALFQKGAFR